MSLSELNKKGTSLFKDTFIYICAFDSDFFLSLLQAQIHTDI